MTVTLSSLRTQVRQRCDMVNSTFVSDSELNSYINGSLAELNDLIVGRYQDYNLTSFQLQVTSTNVISLPSDFYKLKGVDYQIAADRWTSIRSFNFVERNKYNTAGIMPGNYQVNIVYRYQNGNIFLEPETNCDGYYRIWYTPAFTPLTDDSDTYSSLQNWYDYAVVDACIKCLAKEESDTSIFMAQKGNLLDRIMKMAGNVDSGEQATIGDYYDEWL